MGREMNGEQYKGRYILLSVCFIGIFCSYLANGLVVEKVSMGNGFQFYTSIIMVTTAFNAAIAKFFLIFKRLRNGSNAAGKEGQGMSLKTTILIVACSLCYVMAMLTANAALNYVNYPTQIVGKSGKPLVILLMSIIVVQRSYTLKKCASILLVVTGVCMFMLENARKTNTKSNGRKQNNFGVSLVLLSLLFDGFVAITQQKIQEKTIFSSHNLMYNINKWAAFFMFFIALYKGELQQFVPFCRNSIRFLMHMLALCITGVLGQQFIFLTIVNFGPLVCSVITTTRKFFTILLSTVIFQHNLTSHHWVSVIIVFSGLVIDYF